MSQTAICAEIEAESGVDLVQVLGECNLNAPESTGTKSTPDSASISAQIQVHSTNMRMVYFGYHL